MCTSLPPHRPPPCGSDSSASAHLQIWILLGLISRSPQRDCFAPAAGQPRSPRGPKDRPAIELASWVCSLHEPRRFYALTLRGVCRVAGAIARWIALGPPEKVLSYTRREVADNI